jgi:hypothetical protein
MKFRDEINNMELREQYKGSMRLIDGSLEG